MTWLRLERALSYCVAEGELDKGRFHRQSSNLHGLGESRRFRRYASRPSQPKFSQAAPQDEVVARVVKVSGWLPPIPSNSWARH